MATRLLKINAVWDQEARCWVAYSDDVPGLATGADTIEQLVDKLKICVPELLRENAALPDSDENDGIAFKLNAERTERTDRTAA